MPLTIALHLRFLSFASLSPSPLPHVPTQPTFRNGPYLNNAIFGTGLGGDQHAGGLALFRVFNRGLTQAQAMALMTSVEVPAALKDTLAVEYMVNEAVGVTLKDSSGKNSNGLIKVAKHAPLTCSFPTLQSP